MQISRNTTGVCWTGWQERFLVFRNDKECVTNVWKLLKIWKWSSYLLKFRIWCTREEFESFKIEKTGAVSSLKGSAMAQVFNCWPVNTEPSAGSHTCPSEICGGQSGTVTGFSLSTSVVPCQYHSTRGIIVANLGFLILIIRWGCPRYLMQRSPRSRS
jgi:hypothetical protein